MYSTRIWKRRNTCALYVKNHGTLGQIPDLKSQRIHKLAYIITKYLNNPVVVFDGYGTCLSTKDIAHVKRKKKVHPQQTSSSHQLMTLQVSKDFLANKFNKHRFIKCLGDALENIQCSVVYCNGGVESSKSKTAFGIRRWHRSSCTAVTSYSM